MYKLEKNENASQFMITFKPLSVLDGKYVVFGRIISGMNTLRLVCTYLFDLTWRRKQISFLNHIFLIFR